MLSKDECLNILGLEQSANIYDIENRYTILMKRYRGKADPESMKEIDQITLAYSILTGKYVEPEPVDPRMETVIWGKKRKEWRNIWDYGRVPALFTIIVIALVGYFIYSVVTNVPADFQIVVAGIFGASEDHERRVEDYVLEKLPDVQRFEMQMLPLDLRDPEELRDPETGQIEGYNSENQYAYMMKMMTLMAADNIEIYLCDEVVFEHYAIQGAFAPLNELYERIGNLELPDEILEAIVAQRRPYDENAAVPDDIFATPTPGPTAEEFNLDRSLTVYGLDVTSLDLTEGLGIYSDRQILTIGHRAENLAMAEDFIIQWIMDFERMSQQRQEFEDEMTRQMEEELARQNTDQN